MAEPKSEESPSVGKLVENTIRDARELLRAELSLAKGELTAQARSFGGAAICFAASALFLQAAITVLGVLLVLLLGASAWGFVAVGGLLALALGLGLLGLRAIGRIKPRTPARLRADAQQIVEAIK